jgi:hypothetical protein
MQTSEGIRIERLRGNVLGWVERAREAHGLGQ